MEQEPQQQPLKVAVIFGVLVVAIVAALTFKRDAGKPKEPAPGTGRIIVQKPAVNGSATEGPASHLLGRIDQAPIAALDAEEEPRGPVDLSVAPPMLPSSFEREPLTSLATPEPGPGDQALPGNDFGPRKHRVRDGDTLASLAERFLGDAARADEILAVNRASIVNPDLLPIGVELVIPAAEAEEELTPVAPSNTAGR